jgi:hypothetical protein
MFVINELRVNCLIIIFLRVKFIIKIYKYFKQKLKNLYNVPEQEHIIQKITKTIFREDFSQEIHSFPTKAN